MSAGGAACRVGRLPLDVSFGGIDFAELPSEEESHTSYYNFLSGSAYISHTTTAGAGVWHKVGANNYFCRDEAVAHNCPAPWVDDSQHTWAIPHCWRKHEDIVGYWLPNERTDGTVELAEAPSGPVKTSFDIFRQALNECPRESEGGRVKRVKTYLESEVAKGLGGMPLWAKRWLEKHL